MGIRVRRQSTMAVVVALVAVAVIATTLLTSASSSPSRISLVTPPSASTVNSSIQFSTSAISSSLTASTVTENSPSASALRTDSSRGTATIVIPFGAASPGSLNLNFQPAVVTVVMGVNSTIIFVNNATTYHWIESISTPNNAQPFETAILSHGQSYSISLTVPGVYQYQDIDYPVWLHGTIVVESPPS